MDVVEIFKRIEDRIALKYIPGWISWADKTHGGAWTKAFDRVNQVMLTNPPDAAEELKTYERTCMNLINEYFKSGEQWEQTEFLDSIRLTPGEVAERESVKLEIDPDDWFTKAMESL